MKQLTDGDSTESPADQNYDDTVNALRIFDLKRQGLDIPTIALTLNIGALEVKRLITRAYEGIRQLESSSIEEMRELDRARLEKDYFRLEARAENGDEKAILARVKILADLRKMFGVDKPVQQNATVNVNINLSSLSDTELDMYEIELSRGTSPEAAYVKVKR